MKERVAANLAGRVAENDFYIDADRDISMNHIMFGEISAWFYKALGGINPDKNRPGFENIILRPNFVEGLDHFKAVHNGPFGPIKSSWEKGGNKVLYNVTIPPNSRADLYIKGSYSVKEGNPIYQGIAGSIDDSLPDNDDSGAENLIRLVAGSYVFLIENQ